MELYELDKDPGERHNLINATPEKGKDLLANLYAGRAEVKAAMPTESPRTRNPGPPGEH